LTKSNSDARITSRSIIFSSNQEKSDVTKPLNHSVITSKSIIFSPEPVQKEDKESKAINSDNKINESKDDSNNESKETHDLLPPVQDQRKEESELMKSYDRKMPTSKSIASNDDDIIDNSAGHTPPQEQEQEENKEESKLTKSNSDARITSRSIIFSSKQEESDVTKPLKHSVITSKSIIFSSKSD